MSSSIPAGGQPAISRYMYPKPSRKPFNMERGAEESEGEWWSEDEDNTTQPSRAAYVTQRATMVGSSTKAGARAQNRKIEKKYSVHKPIREKSKGRQKKQNALAGIKLVTNFSMPAPVPTIQPHFQQVTSKPEPRFVDLEALQALDPQASEGLGSFWKSRKNRALKKGANAAGINEGRSQNITSSRENAGGTNEISKAKGMAPRRLELDLSPSDRPIVIGISIPSARLTEHSTSPQTAISETSKYTRNYDAETPTIIITPAHAGSIWSALDDNTPAVGPGHRSSSELFSRPPQNAMGIYDAEKAPPMPRLLEAAILQGQQRQDVDRSYFSPDTENGTTWEDDSPVSDVKSRPRTKTFSTGTFFEEDETPILALSKTSLDSSNSMNASRASVNTVATRHRSKGWWNYITTPFLTRSNTVASRGVFENQTPPALPSLATDGAIAQQAGREKEGRKWEKQFSPITPATSTSINSDAWWDISAKENQFKHLSLPEDIHDKRHKVQTSSGTVPLVEAETASMGGLTPEMRTQSPLQRDIFARSPERRAISSPQVIVLNGTRTVETNNYMIMPNSSVQDAQTTQRIRQTEYTPASDRPLSSPPPPPYSPPPRRAATSNDRAVLPLTPGQLELPQSGTPPELQYPSSPGPLSPSLQRAMATRGGIPMSEVNTSTADTTRIPMLEVPLTPGTQRLINLNTNINTVNVNSRYGELLPRNEPVYFEPPPTAATSSKSQKAEAKRRQLEKEDSETEKGGCCWKFLKCIPKRKCCGRSGPESLKKRKWYIGLITAFLTMVILAVALATTLHQKSSTVIGPSQWLNITGFPPIFAGLSTVANPVNIKTTTACIFPGTVWSCSLPKELQSTIGENPVNEPNLLFNIQWDNSSQTNSTFANVTGGSKLKLRGVGNAVSARQFIRHLVLKTREIITFVPNPAPPSFAEGFFLGNTTDGIVSPNKNGEPTPFYISLLQPAAFGLTKREVVEGKTVDFPNITAEIPSPSLNNDGTAAPANLIPLPSQQPIRLYDRDLPTEHYGFYTYYDRSIFLKSIAFKDAADLNDGDSPDDLNGGALKTAANFRVTWAQTRFLIQMWTRMNSTARLNGNLPIKGNFTQPGTFPYPITITIDRHGGDISKKMVYSYRMGVGQSINASSGVLMSEARAFGGTTINPAPFLFQNQTSDPALGGFDGGTSGCNCQWTNFQKVLPAGR
ncbi:hypothetical protein BJ878DRAFT_221643 [Calycina marina]|uniref:Glycoprotease family protein n=1 Tax=Calycina marina TaxID=1763456 RepID=A0A9P8CCF2_9HELO|nr:hypothetical protein BJ878DRAFT_221643 [Calycina marina]